MKKLVLLFAAVFAMTFVSCDQKGTESSAKNDSTKIEKSDSTSNENSVSTENTSEQTEEVQKSK